MIWWKRWIWFTCDRQKCGSTASSKVKYNFSRHYNDVIMSAIASQITSLTIVYSTVYSVRDQRKHQSSASLAFVRGIHRWPVNSLHKGPVTRKMFPFDDVIMYTLNPGQFLVASSAIGSNSGVVNRSLDPENDKAWWSSPENRIIITVTSLRWRRNGRDSVSNHQPHDCLLNRLFRRRSKKTSKLRVTGVLSAPCWSHEPC